MAHVKASATTKGNRDSVSKRRGVKLFGGQKAINGNIIVRQKGTKFFAGNGTRLGRDFTIYAIKSGLVKFFTKLGKKYVMVKG
jgi:large subunit ribosomal protein L27